MSEKKSFNYFDFFLGFWQKQIQVNSIILVQEFDSDSWFYGFKTERLASVCKYTQMFLALCDALLLVGCWDKDLNYCELF